MSVTGFITNMYEAIILNFDCVCVYSRFTIFLKKPLLSRYIYTVKVRGK